jgi:hypothetical protein
MKYIALVLVLVLFSRCDTENSENVCIGRTFIFNDNEGNDLFNENTINHIPIDELKVYTPEGRSLNISHFIYENENVFNIELNGATGEDITLFEIGDITIDTVFVKTKQSGNTLFISELYYNDILLETNTGCDYHTKRITVAPD